MAVLASATGIGYYHGDVNYFLAKTDPETYAIEQLERDRKTVWDGVKNPQALRAIQQMRPKDRVFMYHSGGDAAVVGLAQVVSEPRPDPKSAKLTVVDLEFLTRLDPPTTLHEIKESKRFDDWALVRQGRLSTMAAPESFVVWMKKRYPKIGV
jgi:predicted RNA-binding protein with PUA-like domain